MSVRIPGWLRGLFGAGHAALHPTLVFLCSFAAYAATAAPDVTFTDCGELGAVCATLGVAHPTGYPLLTLLGFLWTRLPWPWPPIRALNLLSAFLTSGSAVLFYYLVRLLYVQSRRVQLPAPRRARGQKKKHSGAAGAISAPPPASPWAYTIAALAYAFACTVWAQATSFEVHSLQLVLLASTLLLFARAHGPEAQSFRAYAPAAAALGLGFANHMTTVLMAPALAFSFFKRPGGPLVFDGEKLRMLARLSLVFAVPLGLYLYLPIRSSMNPLFDWGMVHRGLQPFYYHLLGRQYSNWMFSEPGLWEKHLALFIGLLPSQVGIVGLFPLFYGIYYLYRAGRDLLWFCLLLVAGCFLYALNYSVDDIEPYFLLAVCGLMLIVGVGTAAWAARSPRTLALLALVPVVSFWLNFPVNNHATDRLVPEYTRVLLDSTRPHAVIISAQWDFFCSAFWYKQQVEGVRPDIVLVEKELLRRTWYPQLLLRWYPEALSPCRADIDSYLTELAKFERNQTYDADVLQARYIGLINAIIEKNIEKRPVYVTSEVLASEPELAASYYKRPEGLALRVERTPERPPLGLDRIDLDAFIASRPGSTDRLEVAIRQTAAAAVANLGLYGRTTGQEPEADRAFRMALELDPENAVALANIHP
ncbi:MAG: DUF2723 domain-containing protein [Acidobacteriota bacterium]